MDSLRTISDADVDAICTRLIPMLIDNIKKDIGTGVLSLVKAGIFFILCSLAYLGYKHS
jgi:hypothetical protein